MAVSTQYLVRNNSTLALFKQWAQAISSFFTTAGWVQSSDTGQVNWSSIASVPTAGNSVYEIWKPGDAYQTFYVKIEYGTNSSNTASSIWITVGQGTNGAGSITTFATNRFQLSDNTAGSAVNQYACHFSGDTSRINVMMWRDEQYAGGDAYGSIYFGIQRSLNSSGTPYGTSSTGYVTFIGVGPDNGSHNQNACWQTTAFGVGVTTPVTLNNSSHSFFATITDPVWFINSGIDQFNGFVPLAPIFPGVGFYDNPLDAACVAPYQMVTEGCQYVIPGAQLPYGTGHTYIATIGNNYRYLNQNSTSITGLLMRYD